MRPSRPLSVRAAGVAPAAITLAAVLMTLPVEPRALATPDGGCCPVAVTAYDAGTGAVPGYTDPAAALGEPTRFTGAGIFPGVVSPFNPPWMTHEIVSIGASGSITLEFDPPLTDDPDHPFGIDAIVFSNGFFIDAAYPAAIVGGFFSSGGGTIEVSDDLVTWHGIPGVTAASGLPTLGYLDAGPYDTERGTILSDFRRPVDPAVAPDDLAGTGWRALLDLYGLSGGGTGIDLAAAGVTSARYVRVSNAPDAVEPIAVDAVQRVRVPLTGDLNGDGVVDFDDMLLLLAAFGRCGGGACPADLDGNGVVDFGDLLMIVASWS